MKCLIAADLHLSSYKSPYFNVLNQIKLGLYDIIQYLRKHEDVDSIIIAGDIFNDKSFIYKTAMDTMDEFLCSPELQDKQIILITGNHDISRHGNLLDSLKHYENSLNLTIVDKYYKYDNILCVAYNHDMYTQLQNAVSEFPECDVLVSHFGVSEAKLQSGISIVSNISAKNIKYFKRVILGHYHLQQQVKNIIYVGNLAPLNWNDKNEKKGYIIYDTETDTIEYIYPNCYINFYEFVDPKEDEYQTISTLTAQGHIVRVLSTKPLPASLKATTVVQLKTVQPKFKNVQSVADIAKEFVKDHPEEKELLHSFNDIHKRVQSNVA